MCCLWGSWYLHNSRSSFPVPTVDDFVAAPAVLGADLPLHLQPASALLEDNARESNTVVAGDGDDFEFSDDEGVHKVRCPPQACATP